MSLFIEQVLHTGEHILHLFRPEEKNPSKQSVNEQFPFEWSKPLPEHRIQLVADVHLAQPA